MANPIKKAFLPLVELLQANLDKTVEDVMGEVMAIAEVSRGSGAATSFHKDDNGVVLAIRCTYLDKWLHLGAPNVEFGIKASTASGYNAMCKHGLNNWNKQQTEAKRAKEQLLKDVASGEVDASELPEVLAAIEAARIAVAPLEGDYQGFETLEECLADAEANGFVVEAETPEQEEE